MKTTNFKTFLSEKVNTPQELSKEIEKVIKKHFPKSFVHVKLGGHLGYSITVTFAYYPTWKVTIHNDPGHHSFMVGWDSFGKEGEFTKDKIEAELNTGGFSLIPEPGSYLAYDTKGASKIGWRKKQLPPIK